MMFAAPWVLLGLLALPGLYFLLRVTPPAARRIAFPPVSLLLVGHRRSCRTGFASAAGIAG